MVYITCKPYLNIKYLNLNYYEKNIITYFGRYRACMRSIMWINSKHRGIIDYNNKCYNRQDDEQHRLHQ